MSEPHILTMPQDQVTKQTSQAFIQNKSIMLNSKQSASRIPSATAQLDNYIYFFMKYERYREKVKDKFIRNQVTDSEMNESEENAFDTAGDSVILKKDQQRFQLLDRSFSKKRNDQRANKSGSPRKSSRIDYSQVKPRYL